MTTIQFKCTLLSDVILNQKAATEDPNQTLDFIPGSNFLGIAASSLYSEMNEQTMTLFHSGKVRFGDAHPSIGNFRGLKVPASMFYPKLGKASEELYIHHCIPNLDDDTLRQKQLKQCRKGFYDFSDNRQAQLISSEKNYAIKSAYDKNTRRTRDGQLYGYQSLQKGLELYFEVATDENQLVESITKALVGIKRIGRSRTAQYGLIQIDKCDTPYQEANSQASNDEYTVVYADGRLIFLDEYDGIVTFRPTAEQLGLDGEVCWEKSQIRIFQYAPWNFQRQCFDTDRCGIEKGSVIVVKRKNGNPAKSQYVGAYRNEGFGKVIYNPAFLKANADGRAQMLLVDDLTDAIPQPGTQATTQTPAPATSLINYLRLQKRNEDIEVDVYTKVNNWVSQHATRFHGKTFASQWGKIRSIAMINSSQQAITNALFEPTNGYLMHGVAADKWKESGRKDKLEVFINQLTDDNAQIAIINLAAEMAKKCSED